MRGEEKREERAPDYVLMVVNFLQKHNLSKSPLRMVTQNVRGEQ